MPQATRKRRKLAAPLGGMYVVLLLIGVVTIIVICIRLTSAVLDNSKEKQMFEDIIRPVVMFNPAPFEKPTDIEMKNLLLYSMWSALMGEKRDSYQFSENSELLVPASDLNVTAKRLFGSDVELEHQTFGEFDTIYYYDEDTESYNVPTTVLTSVYTPLVETITKTGDFYELYVGYVPSGISYKTDFSGGRGQPAPEKHMNYVMQKSKNGYFIAKVKDPKFIEASQVPPPSQPPAAEQNQSQPESTASPESQSAASTAGSESAAESGAAESGAASEAGASEPEASASSDSGSTDSSDEASDAFDEPTPELESSGT